MGGQYLRGEHHRVQDLGVLLALAGPDGLGHHLVDLLQHVVDRLGLRAAAQLGAVGRAACQGPRAVCQPAGLAAPGQLVPLLPQEVPDSLFHSEGAGHSLGGQRCASCTVVEMTILAEVRVLVQLLCRERLVY